MNLAMALSSSVNACMENMRLSPLSGFMRLNLGAREALANSQPPSDIGPTTAAINSTNSTGCAAIRAIFPEASRNSAMERSSTITSRLRLKLMRIKSIIICARPPPNASRPPAPANITARVLSSLERAISPFSRESCLRFSVGSSVLS
ncbi:hypothetical protein D3C85_1022510 [compost metagenome]